MKGRRVSTLRSSVPDRVHGGGRFQCGVWPITMTLKEMKPLGMNHSNSGGERGGARKVAFRTHLTWAEVTYNEASSFRISECERLMPETLPPPRARTSSLRPLPLIQTVSDHGVRTGLTVIVTPARTDHNDGDTSTIHTRLTVIGTQAPAAISAIPNGSAAAGRHK
jgi:hypothetical protein